MFKAIMIMAALALAGDVASAADITLSPWNGAGALHQYHEVTTDAGDNVTIYLPQYSVTGGFQFWFDSQYDVAANHFKSYWVGTYNGSGVMSQAQKCVFGTDASGNYLPTCDLNGEVALVTLTDTSRRVCTRSGRGQSCHSVWQLLSGTISQ